MDSETPSPPLFDYKAAFDEIAELLRPIDRHWALLECRHALAYWQDEPCEPDMIEHLSTAAVPPQPQFNAANLARLILLNCADGDGRPPNKAMLARVMTLVWEIHLNDHASKDLATGEADLVGFLIRYMSAQLAYEPANLKSLGLFHTLYTDAMPVGRDEPLDIPATLKDILGMPTADFMRAGISSMSLRAKTTPGGIRLNGIVTTKYANDSLPAMHTSVQQCWKATMQRLSCDSSTFRTEAMASMENDDGPAHWLYAFNPLAKYPFIRVTDDEWIAPVPNLVFARVTRGLWYDLSDARVQKFYESFGARFQQLVGDITASACGPNRVVLEKDLPDNIGNHLNTKHADVIIKGRHAHVLVECKSLQMNQQLLMYGLKKDVDDISCKIAKALRQIIEHDASIRKGEWAEFGVPCKPSVGILVTYGQITAVQGMFLRSRVESELAAMGCTPIPYLLLSITEYDSYLCLIETGRKPDEIVRVLVDDEAGAFPGRYKDVLAKEAISKVTRYRGKKVMDSIIQD